MEVLSYQLLCHAYGDDDDELMMMMMIFKAP